MFINCGGRRINTDAIKYYIKAPAESFDVLIDYGGDMWCAIELASEQECDETLAMLDEILACVNIASEVAICTNKRESAVAELEERMGLRPIKKERTASCSCAVCSCSMYGSMR